jgi:hypothetical protein
MARNPLQIRGAGKGARKMAFHVNFIDSIPYRCGWALRRVWSFLIDDAKRSLTKAASRAANRPDCNSDQVQQNPQRTYS